MATLNFRPGTKAYSAQLRGPISSLEGHGALSLRNRNLHNSAWFQTPLLHTQHVMDKMLWSSGTDYPEVLRGFLLYVHENTVIVPQARPQSLPHPYKFIIH
jgi:hypothetical protein